MSVIVIAAGLRAQVFLDLGAFGYSLKPSEVEAVEGLVARAVKLKS